MWNFSHPLTLVLAGAALQLTTAIPIAAAASGEAAKKDRPSQVEVIDGSKVKRVILTEKAAQRLDIQTGEVGSEGAGRMTTPYSSILYDTGGGAWVYTVQKPLTYVRQSVVVEAIKGDRAYFKQGPPAGTKVVTVGVAELYGAEKGVGH